LNPAGSDALVSVKKRCHSWKWLAGILAVACVHGASAPRVALFAHRGEHRHHPENTLPAIQGAIEAGADFVELDVRTTADGALVLMHDRTVERTTDGHGLVAELTLEQVKALDPGAKFAPGFAGTRVPTFDEALGLARGRIGVYVDVKAVRAEDLVAALERHAMQDRVVIYADPAFLGQIVVLRPALRVMPEAENAAELERLLEQLPLRVAAFGERDFDDATLAVARRARIDIFVDRLGKADSPDAWRAAIERGATGIQTDFPAELRALLRAYRSFSAPAESRDPAGRASPGPHRDGAGTDPREDDSLKKAARSQRLRFGTR
jgi:glycerophosphoryl diester phosphodiesterase